MVDTLQDMRILLVDDDESIRDSLSMFFEGEGIRIQTLGTAEDAIEVLKQQSYDVIITDYRLPGMDGLAFLKHVRTLCPDAFKILITAYGGYEVLIAIAGLGVTEYIEKPFSARLIKDALSRMMEKR